ncbi:STAS/SEC14 domain-containing protein [Thioclava sp. JM3]|uniref:STAS/SEC14 domain-containing protein n=1 Tax=Thioclava sp. JM3 TaxID=1973004 RepID=UPI00143C016D|nr:STAS/SEC14 domain-containing protein [Thioclava sp. JM3]
MFTSILHVDPRVVAFDATGEITDQDYTDVLIPALEQAIETNGKARALIRFGEAFEDYTARAALDDAQFGLTHLSDFEKIAVATDTGWIHNGVALFAHLSPIPVRLFAGDQTDAAFVWLTEDT